MIDEGRLFNGLIWAVVTWSAFVLFYRFGGWKKKAWRRYAGGISFPASLIGIGLYVGSFSWWNLVGLVAYPAWLHLGYGANKKSTKCLRRALYGFVAGCCAAPFCLPGGLWGILALQTVIAITTSIYYGVKNPISATGEEGTLGGVFTVLTVFTQLR